MTFRGLFFSSLSFSLPLLLASCGVEKNASLGWGGDGEAQTKPSLQANEGEQGGFFAARKARREAVRKAEAEAEMALMRTQLGRPNGSVPGVRPGSPEEYELRARAGLMASRERKREARRIAKLAAERNSSATTSVPPAGPAVYTGEVEIHERAGDNKRQGWFSGLGFGRSRRGEKTPDHQIFVNHDQIEGLNASNASIEIDLSDQRARVFRRSGSVKTLIIDTQISTGMSGFETPTGRYSISEKSAEKQSTIYGVWYDANGTPVPSNGESAMRPAGATQFVGAEMPCWLRITGGIGLHIGEVPGYPASHGCIRVPAAIQPLIFSKVDLGTPVTVVR